MCFRRLLSLYNKVEPECNLLFGPFYLYVEATGLSVSEAALQRVDKIWKLFSSNPKPANVPFCVGVVIDSHWVAAESDFTLSQLYREKKAPEQVTAGIIVAENRPIAEQLWRPAGPWCTPSTMPPKLLRKGLPDPPSDRYISGTFQKDLKAKDPLAETIIDAAILGAFHHATVIAPPEVRRKVYAGTVDRAALIDSLPSRELYFLVAEHVIAITKGHPALHMAVSATCTGFDVYCREALTRVPRKKLWVFGQPQKTPRRCRSAPSARQKLATCSAAALLPAITRALGIKLKTTAPPVHNREAFELGRVTASAHLDILTLEKLLTPAAAAVFCAELMGAGRPVKKATSAVAKLSPKNKDLLSAFFRGRMAVAAGLSSTLRAFPKNECEVLVCRRCMTLRSGSKGLGRLNSSGVNINCLNGNITCLDCGGDVFSVQLGAVVWRQLIKKPTLITMCDECKLPTTISDASAIGAGYLCHACMEQHRRVPDLCICGEFGNTKNLARVATNTKTVLYAICDMCARQGIPQRPLSLKSCYIY